MYFEITILFQSLPTYSLAAENKNGKATVQSDIEQGKSDIQLKIVNEEVDKRTENAKTFKLSDGSFEVAQYQYPVHYKDSTGKWQNIDNSLSKNTDTSVVDEKTNSQDNIKSSKLFGYTANFANDWINTFKSWFKKDASVNDSDGFVGQLADDIRTGLKNKKNTFDVKFSENTSKSALVRVKDGNNKITWGLDEKNLNRKRTLTQQSPTNKAPANTSKIKNEQDFTTLKNIQTNCIYTDILPNVDLQYKLISKDLKENIILKNKSAQADFHFNYKLNGLKMRYSVDGSIEIYNPKNNIAQYRFPKPIMFDDAGATSDSLKLTFKESNSQYKVCLSADKSWINDANRKYPITVDPVIQTTQIRDQIHETFVASGTNSYNSNYTDWGQLYVGREQNYNVYRSYIKFELPQLKRTARIASAKIYLYQYAAYTKSGVKSNISRMEVDAHKVTGNLDTAKVTWNTQPSYDSSISDYRTCKNVQRWVYFDITKIANEWYTTGTNNGLVLTAKDESINIYIEFLSSDNKDVGSGAYPSVLIQYFDTNGLEDYWTCHSQNAGRAGTGYVNDYTGNVTVVENDIAESGLNSPVSVNHVFNNASALSDNRVTDGMGLGRGWNLDVVSTIKKTSNLDGYPYCLTDGDGTEHYFCDSTDNKYKCEDDQNLILSTVDGSELNIKLEYKDGTIEKYDMWGYLRRKISPNGNTIRYNYSPGKHADNYITSIWDGSGRKILLHYNDKQVLMSIVDSSGRTTKFNYNNQSTGDYLTSITYPDGKSVKYTYSGNKISSLIDIDGYKMSYTAYDRCNRCTGITETGVDGSSGQNLSIDYSKCFETKFTDKIKNRTDTYQFDNWGHTVSVMDSDGNAQMYKYTTSDKNKHNISASGATQKTVYNYLSNPGFEDGLTDWEGRSGVAVTSGGIGGGKMLKVSGSNTDTTANAIQYLELPQGTYTLSGYLKTENVVADKGGNGAGFGIYKFCDGERTWHYSEQITGTTNTTDNDGWKFIQFTFTLNSGESLRGISVGLLHASGTAYFDNLQLEKGNVANKYNLIDNGSFEKSSGGSCYDWKTNTSSNDGISSACCSDGGSKSFCINGRPWETRSIHQTLNLSGSEGDIYTLSGWAKADSLPFCWGAECSLIARIYYTDNSSIDQKVKFNPYVNGWQFASGIITTDDKKSGPPKSYNKIEIYASYDKNINTAYFDGIQLLKDDGNSYTYDDKGNLVSTTDASKTSSTYNYDGNNNVIDATSPTGSKFTYVYDSKKNLTSMTNNAKVKYSFTYDSKGNPISTLTEGDASKPGTDGKKLTMSSKTAYTSDGNYASSVTDSRGNTVYSDYGKNLSAAEYNKGLLRTSTDANGNAISNTYDPNTDIALSTSAVINKGKANQKTVTNNYAYKNDKLDSITHNGFNYNFAYDSFGNQSSVSVGKQKLITNNYETHNGNLLSSTYGNGATVSNNYDSNDRIISKAYNGKTLFSWIYGSLGNVASHTDSVNNVTYKYNYDFSGRLTSFAGNNGFAGNYTYDKTSRLSALSDILGKSSYKTSYTYNADNLPISLTAGQSDTISYNYDGLSRLSSKKFSVGSNSVANNYSYLAGANGNTTTLVSNYAISKTANGANSNLHKYSYTYDKNGNILTISDSGTLKAKYTYDELNELTREDNAVLNKSIVYSYDAGGNLTAKTEYAYTTGTLGTIKSTHSYNYGDSNWKDKLTSYDGSAITYDAIGNPLSYIGGLSFTWQNGRQLAAAKNSSHNVSYKYNSDGIRTSKTVDGVTTNYYIEGGNIAWQTDGKNTIHYTYDADGNLVYMNLNGSLYYYERNAQNDIVGLIDTNMNEVVTYSY